LFFACVLQSLTWGKLILLQFAVENTNFSIENLEFGIGLVRVQKGLLKNNMAKAHVGLSQVSRASAATNRLCFLITSSLLCPPLLSCHKVHGN